MEKNFKTWIMIGALALLAWNTVLTYIHFDTPPAMEAFEADYNKFKTSVNQFYADQSQWNQEVVRQMNAQFLVLSKNIPQDELKTRFDEAYKQIEQAAQKAQLQAIYDKGVEDGIKKAKEDSIKQE